MCLAAPMVHKRWWQRKKADWQCWVVVGRHKMHIKWLSALGYSQLIVSINFVCCLEFGGVHFSEVPNVPFLWESQFGYGIFLVDCPLFQRSIIKPSQMSESDIFFYTDGEVQKSFWRWPFCEQNVQWHKNLITLFVYSSLKVWCTIIIIDFIGH